MIEHDFLTRYAVFFASKFCFYPCFNLTCLVIVFVGYLLRFPRLRVCKKLETQTLDYDEEKMKSSSAKNNDSQSQSLSAKFNDNYLRVMSFIAKNRSIKKKKTMKNKLNDDLI